MRSARLRDKSLLDLLRARSLAFTLTDTRRHTTLDVAPYNAGVSIDDNSQTLGLTTCDSDSAR